MILLLHVIPNSRASSIVVLRSSRKDVDWIAVYETLKKYGKNVKEKSRSHQSGQTEIIYELTVSDEEKLIQELEHYEKIEQINLLSHDGEYRI